MSNAPLRASAAAALLIGAALALSLAGCPSSPPPPPADPLDPGVVAALAKRPDLAPNRVFVLGMDGLDPVLLEERIKAGKCPNFLRLMNEGAHGPLRSQQPMLSPLLWTTIATGKWPTEHGVLDFMAPGGDDPSRKESVTSAHRQVEAMWDIAGRYGKKVGLVGWLASHPAEKVNGFAVSERNELLAYLFNQKINPSKEGKTWPPELVDRVAALRRAPSSFTREEVAPYASVSEDEYRTACQKDEFSNDLRTNDLRMILAASENFRRVGTTLYREQRPDLFCIYFEEVDAVSHYAMCYRDPLTWKPREAEEIARFLPPEADLATIKNIVARIRGEGKGDPPVEVPESQAQYVPLIKELARGAEASKVERWGHAVDAAYDHMDAVLGEVMGQLDASSTLIVLSDHGFAFADQKPPFDSSFNSRMGGANYHRENGYLGLFGKGVRKGFAIPPFAKGTPPKGARLIDICPTVLALMGFPKAQDMPGRVLAEYFETALETGSVPTYEHGRVNRLAREKVEGEEKRIAAGGAHQDTGAGNEAVLQIRAVGYLGSEEEGEARPFLHRASSFQEQGRIDEAVEAYREALKVARDKQRQLVLANLGTLLRERPKPDEAAKKRDLDEAEGIFKQALTEKRGEAPLALAGLAMIAERKGDFTEAVKRWEEVLRINPGEPTTKICIADNLRQEGAAAGGPKQRENLARALQFLRQAAIPEGKEEPDYAAFGPGGHNVRGMVLVENEQFPEALEAFRTAAERSPSFVNPRTNLGVLSMRLASRDLQEASAEADPAKRNGLVASAAAHRKECLQRLDEALAIDPDNAKAHYNRAEALFRLPPRDAEGAEKALELAVKANPLYAKARKLLDEVRAVRGKPGPVSNPPPR